MSIWLRGALRTSWTRCNRTATPTKKRDAQTRPAQSTFQIRTTPSRPPEATSVPS